MHDHARLLTLGARCQVSLALRRTRAAAVIARDFSSRFCNRYAKPLRVHLAQSLSNLFTALTSL